MADFVAGFEPTTGVEEAVNGEVTTEPVVEPAVEPKDV